MSPGAWKGNSIYEDNKILILGESHYGDKNQSDNKIGMPVPYETREVVQEYFSHKLVGDTKARWDRFFDQIAGCFGYPADKGVLFFDKVWFGNYVPVLCGITEKNQAKVFMKDNRIDYNNELFKFVNENEIDTVICFSKATFWNLPAASDQDRESYREYDLPRIGGRRNTLLFYKYSNVPHGSCDVILNKPLSVYGIRHPSAKGGFRSRDVYEVLSNEDLLKGICFRLLQS